MGVRSGWGDGHSSRPLIANPQISALSKPSLAGEGVAGLGVTLCRSRSRGGARLGSSGVVRGRLGSFQEVMPCGCGQSGCWGCEPCPSPFCLLSAGSRAPCLHAQGVLPAHQPPPALHPEAGPDPHGEPGATGGRRGWGSQHPTCGFVRSRVLRAVP